jgi:hypothetical protein
MSNIINITDNIIQDTEVLLSDLMSNDYMPQDTDIEVIEQIHNATNIPINEIPSIIHMNFDTGEIQYLKDIIDDYVYLNWDISEGTYTITIIGAIKYIMDNLDRFIGNEDGNILTMAPKYRLILSRIIKKLELLLEVYTEIIFNN